MPKSSIDTKTPPAPRPPSLSWAGRIHRRPRRSGLSPDIQIAALPPSCAAVLAEISVESQSTIHLVGDDGETLVYSHPRLREHLRDTGGNADVNRGARRAVGFCAASAEHSANRVRLAVQDRVERVVDRPEVGCLDLHQVGGLRGNEQVDVFCCIRPLIGDLSLIHISEPTRRTPISYAV